MKRSIKAITTLFLASVMCFGLSSAAFAGTTSLDQLADTLDETASDDAAAPSSEASESDIPEDAIVLTALQAMRSFSLMMITVQ